jgi:hypothetical protein
MASAEEASVRAVSPKMSRRFHAHSRTGAALMRCCGVRARGGSRRPAILGAPIRQLWRAVVRWGWMDLSEYVAVNTRLLREDQELFWTRLRECLRDRGVDPMHCVLATCFPDDNAFEFGIVVTPDDEVFEFGFDYLRVDIAEGVLSEWTRTTDRWRNRPFLGEVEAAMALRAAE